MASTMNRTQGKLFQRMTISYTVLVALVLALLIPLYSRTLNIVKEQSLRDNYSVLQNAFYILKNRIDLCSQGILYAYGDPIFKNLAVLPKRLDPIDYYKLRTAQGFVASLIKTDDLIREYLIYFPGNGITFTNGRVFDSVESAYGPFLKYEGLDFSAWIKEMTHSADRQLWPERGLQRYDDTGQRNTLTYAMTFPPGSTSQTRVIAAFILDKERLLEAGFDGYVSKPLYIKDLVEEMKKVKVKGQ